MYIIQYVIKILLIRNEYRPEQFAPIGGVFKYFSSAKELLNRLYFKAEVRSGNIPDLKHDLRGFIPGKSLPEFIRWFMSGKQREVEPLTRELIEGLNEIGLDAKPFMDEPFKFELVRPIYEGPRSVPGVAYMQFRFMQIYQFSPDCKSGQKLMTVLFDEVAHNHNLISATGEEIRKRRASTGERIGEHSCYLVGDEKTCAEPAPF